MPPEASRTGDSLEQTKQSFREFLKILWFCFSKEKRLLTIIVLVLMTELILKGFKFLVRLVI